MTELGVALRAARTARRGRRRRPARARRFEAACANIHARVDADAAGSASLDELLEGCRALGIGEAAAALLRGPPPPTPTGSGDASSPPTPRRRVDIALGDRFGAHVAAEAAARARRRAEAAVRDRGRGGVPGASAAAAQAELVVRGRGRAARGARRGSPTCTATSLTFSLTTNKASERERARALLSGGGGAFLPDGRRRALGDQVFDGGPQLIPGLLGTPGSIEKKTSPDAAVAAGRDFSLREFVRCVREDRAGLGKLRPARGARADGARPRALASLSDRELAALFDRVDDDRSNSLSFDEFCGALARWEEDAEAARDRARRLRESVAIWPDDEPLSEAQFAALARGARRDAALWADPRARRADRPHGREVARAALPRDRPRRLGHAHGDRVPRRARAARRRARAPAAARPRPRRRRRERRRSRASAGASAAESGGGGGGGDDDDDDLASFAPSLAPSAGTLGPGGGDRFCSERVARREAKIARFEADIRDLRAGAGRAAAPEPSLPARLLRQKARNEAEREAATAAAAAAPAPAPRRAAKKPKPEPKPEAELREGRAQAEGAAREAAQTRAETATCAGEARALRAERTMRARAESCARRRGRSHEETQNPQENRESWVRDEAHHAWEPDELRDIQTNVNGRSIVARALHGRNHEIVRNPEPSGGVTPLHYAAWRHLKVARLLIAARTNNLLLQLAVNRAKRLSMWCARPRVQARRQGSDRGLARRRRRVRRRGRRRRGRRRRGRRRRPVRTRVCSRSAWLARRTWSSAATRAAGGARRGAAAAGRGGRRPRAPWRPRPINGRGARRPRAPWRPRLINGRKSSCVARSTRRSRSPRAQRHRSPGCIPVPWYSVPPLYGRTPLGRSATMTKETCTSRTPTRARRHGLGRPS